MDYYYSIFDLDDLIAFYAGFTDLCFSSACKGKELSMVMKVSREEASHTTVMDLGLAAIKSSG